MQNTSPFSKKFEQKQNITDHSIGLCLHFVNIFSALLFVQLCQVHEHRVNYCAQQNAAHDPMRDAMVT